MKRRTIAVAGSMAMLLSTWMAAGCGTVQPPVMPNFEGFEAFATPREFDGPGSIYRIEADGKRFPAGKVDFSAMGGGMEVMPKYSRSLNLSLDQLLKNLGASAQLLPVSISANLSRTSEVNIESTTGTRLRADTDDTVNAALQGWKPATKPSPNDQYFLIRETIQTRKLTYTVKNDWLASAGLDIQSLAKAGYTGTAKAASNNGLSLDASFERDLNVYYKTQRIEFRDALGAGPGNYIVIVGPLVQGALLGL